MTRPCFGLLCQNKISFIGESKFKYEAFIDAFLKDKISMYNAHTLTTCGYISGEVKLAVTLRLLAGGDELDLATIFDIYSDYFIKIMYDVLTQWIIPSNVEMINMMKYLGNDMAMEQVSMDFQRDPKVC